MEKIRKVIKRIPRSVYVMLVIILVVVVLWQLPKEPTAEFVVIEPVGIGEVSNGITAQGTLRAAQKIDLNVYKRELRLREVSMTNGEQVQAGAVLFAYQKDDMANDIAKAQLDYQNTVLQLREARISAQNTNFAVVETEQEINSVKNLLERLPSDQSEARRVFYSSELRAVPSVKRSDAQAFRAKPVVTGTYTGEQGVYEIEVYASNAESGYSFRLKGLESGTFTIYPEVEQELGNLGLRITFPAAANIKTSDVWLIKIPNVDAAGYLAAKKTYGDTLVRLNEQIEKSKIEKEQKTTNLQNQQRTDSFEFRQLAVAKAELAVAQAAEAIRSAERNAEELTITAPFSGTISGIRNVVEKTVLRTDDTTVQLGTLLSNDFVATFSLRINDVTKVSIGDEVDVTIPSLPGESILKANITEISALPNEAGGYDVRASLTVSTSTQTKLREGLAVDLNIPREKVSDVVRIPIAAIQYENESAFVFIVPTIGPELSSEITSFGSVNIARTGLVSEKRFIKIGLIGQNFIEIIEGLKAGDYILTSANLNQTSQMGAQSGSGVEFSVSEEPTFE